MKKNKKRILCYRWLTMLLTVCLFFNLANAQNDKRTLKGVVTDPSGETLIGVTIIEIGTNNGTVTDLDGNFTLQVKAGAKIKFSYVGYNANIVTVGNQSTLNIIMEHGAGSELDEVVVVGYGVVKKKDLTGSVASVNSQKLMESPGLTVAEAMQGKIPGMLVTKSSWKPGASASVLIRGTRSISAKNDPLYVVDGIPVTGALDEIPPGDIESVDVLKDASATAIYGSRGANGVIIITTKKGKTGKVQVDYNGYFGFQTIKNKLELMNGAEYADYIRESYRGKGEYSSATPDKTLDFTIAAFGGNPTKPNDSPLDAYTWQSIAMAYDANGNYNPSKIRSGALWWKDVEQTGIVTDHQATVRGGNDKTQFALGLTYFSNEGVYKTQQYDRYSVRLSLDTEVTDWLKIGGQTQFSHSVNKRGRNFQDDWRVNPLGALYDENGNLTECTTGVDVQYWNPLQYLVNGAIVNPLKVNRFFGSYYVEVKLPLDGLKYRLNAGIDYFGVEDNSFSSSLANQGRVNSASNSKTNTYAYTIENLLFYNKEIGEHSFGGTLLQSVEQNRKESLNASVENLPSDYLTYNDIASALTIKEIGSNNTVASLASFMGRVNYNYKGRYYLTASMRYDGSSRLADGHKWVAFPSFSLAWRMNEESFLNYESLDNLKLRFGYGVTANQSVDPYQTKGLLSKKYYNYGNDLVIGYAPGDLPDKNLTWETTKQWNIGLDFGFFKGRINGTLDIYSQNTYDLLLHRQIPAVSGYSRTLTNIGKTKNTGLELSLNTVNLSLRDFLWTSNFTYSTNKEEIVELYNGKTDDIGNKWFIGEAVNTFYDYNKIGIWQNTPEDLAEMAKFNTNGHKFKPGQIRVEDIDKDYRISADKDRVIIGQRNPKHIFYLGNTFVYKGFDLNVVAYSTLGGMLSNNIRYNHQSDRNNNVKYDYWTATNPTNAYPQPDRGFQNIDYESSLYYEKSDFLRLKTVTLGYTLPKKLIIKAALSRCRIYFTAENPLLFTNYSGIDPEGATGYAAPSLSSWILGLNLSF
ncbi:SusC/RagA family TonB-linked outer membrane protein [Dysgonomonas termitidis]|uniref:SusC/RagA family TonB-linked outer membrane protein n=1 Tax=Dysgonomonas termitidis TaxID=1516126 RepID=A0ABV9L0I6_9BACT